MAHMTDEEWAEYRDSINEFSEDAFQQPVTWRKNITRTSKHGEDDNMRYTDITIKGLALYNYFRSWPMNTPDITGEIDKESVLLYLNNQYLNELGYVNEHNNFKFNPSLDRFILDGLIYKTSGDAQVAQAKDAPLLHFLILKREEQESQDSMY